MPNPTTVAAIDAACRGDVVELGTPAEAIAERARDDRGSGWLGSRAVRSVKRTAQLRRDFRHMTPGAHWGGSDALELIRIGSRAELEP